MVMFEEFYGFKTSPFSKTPDPNFIYKSKAHSEALARLEIAVENKDIILLTGEVGCGKTTLCRVLIDSLDDRYKPILLINPRYSATQFLKILAKRLGIEEVSNLKMDIIESIEDEMFSLYEKGITPVVIIDEAQLIPDRSTFDEMRLLTNFQLDDENLFSLILVGQRELRNRLSGPHFRAFRQRIGFQYHLSPFNIDDTHSYVKHRLSVAGRKKRLFSDDAIKRIFILSGGIPRVINTVCTNALIEGFNREAELIDEKIIDAISDEFLFINCEREKKKPPLRGFVRKVRVS